MLLINYKYKAQFKTLLNLTDLKESLNTNMYSTNYLLGTQLQDNG